MVSGLVMLLAALAVLTCSFVVTLAESAFLSVNLVRLNDLKVSDKRAVRVMHLLVEKPKVITSLIFVDIMSDVLLTLIIGSTLFNAGLVGFAVGALIASVLIAICSTLIPMTIGMAIAIPLSLAMSRAVLVITKVISPLLAPLVHAVDEFERALGKNTQTATDDLVSYMGMLVDNGKLESNSALFVEQAIRALGLSVSDIATQIENNEKLPIVATVRDALINMGTTQRTRLVVFDGSPSDIVGIVSFMSISKAIAEGKFDSSVSECVFMPPIVKRNDKLDAVFKQMIDARITVALIKEGDYVGVIGINDITEKALLKAS
nr:CNNM domain-containing protein [Ferrimicrobium acidiphilum]